jgi:hypothetical protein
MANYIVIYEGQAGSDKRAALREAVKRYAGWGILTSNSWVVVAEHTAASLRDELRRLIGPNDRLFVVRSGVEAAWINVAANSDWLKRNL